MDPRDDFYELVRLQDLIDWYDDYLESHETWLPKREHASVTATLAALITRRERLDQRRLAPATQPD